MFSSRLFPQLLCSSRVSQKCCRCVEEAAWEKLYIQNTQLIVEVPHSCTLAEQLASCFASNLHVVLSQKQCCGISVIGVSWVSLLFPPSCKEASSYTYFYHLLCFPEIETKFIVILSESIFFYSSSLKVIRLPYRDSNLLKCSVIYNRNLH